MIDKAANECRRQSCYNFAVLKTAETRSQGNELLEEGKRRKGGWRREEERGEERLTPGEVK